MKEVMIKALGIVLATGVIVSFVLCIWGLSNASLCLTNKMNLNNYFEYVMQEN